MDPDSLLFVGGAETLWQLTDRFEPVQISGCFAYRPTPKSRASTRPPAQTTYSSHRPPVAAAVVRPTLTSAQPDLGDDRLAVGLAESARLKAAVVSCRQRAFLTPDDPMTHFDLGMALAAAGEDAASRRAYRVASAALDRCDDADISDVLQGYDRAAFSRLLRDRAATPDETTSSRGPS